MATPEASTETLLAKAAELGKLIAAHEAAKQLTAATQKIRSDASATQAIQNFNRLLQTLSMKEQSGMPIEPAEKRQLETLQQAVATNIALRSFQTAQVAYVDLMRQVDEALTSAGPDPMAGPGSQEPQPASAPPASRLVY
jgi:cell fate (sporulation/competence/biofilm development) regulator YlbF (YheA/YmcA/DUF963 family)